MHTRNKLDRERKKKGFLAFNSFILENDVQQIGQKYLPDLKPFIRLCAGE